MRARERYFANSGDAFSCATLLRNSPSNSHKVATLAPQSRIAFARIIRNTGPSSVGELLIACKISLVAACCSTASASRCSSCPPVGPPILRDFLVTDGLASTLTFVGFTLRCIAPPCHSRALQQRTIGNRLRRPTVSRKVSVLYS